MIGEEGVRRLALRGGGGSVDTAGMVIRARGLMRLVVLVGVAGAAGAQQPAAVVGMGIVTGHVTCGDTQKPARFAQVMLVTVPTSITPPADPKANPDAAQMKKAMNTVMGSMNIVQTQTGMDGAYAVGEVAPGDYYVFASVPGYVQPVAKVQAAQEAGVDLTKEIPGVSIVHVAADKSVSSDLTLDRGAAVAGRVMWDDGSPASRVNMTVETKTAADAGKAKELPPQFSLLGLGGGYFTTTDDLGQYRIAGLAAGSYVVRATLQVQNSFRMTSGTMNLKNLVSAKPLVIYAPTTFHKAEAKAVTLHAGDEQSGEDVTINLAGMHSVSGSVASAEDHHGINSATVELTDVNDKDLVRSAIVDAAGNFTVTFVPPGTYNMAVTGAADTQPSKKQPSGLIRMTMPETVKSYADGKQSVVVTDSDVVGLVIELAPDKTKKPDVDVNELLKQ
jgi:hypothetical protein